MYIFSRIFNKREFRENMYTVKICTFTVVQNFALRAVLSGLDPLERNVIELHDIVPVKMLKHCMLSQLMMCIRNAYRNHTLPVVNHNVVTCGNGGAALILPIPRIKFLRKCPFYWGAQIWNSLPYNIRTTDSKEVYRNTLQMAYCQYKFNQKSLPGLISYSPLSPFLNHVSSH